MAPEAKAGSGRAGPDRTGRTGRVDHIAGRSRVGSGRVGNKETEVDRHKSSNMFKGPRKINHF